MSTAELKNYLHQLIVETNDPSILSKVQDYFQAIISEIPLSHQKEILSRKEAIENENMATQSWEDVKKELLG